MSKILIIGCGDIAMRIAPLLAGRYRLYGLTRNKERFATLRAAGFIPVVGDLDKLHSLDRIAGLADFVLHLAPPPTEGCEDLRTRHLLAALGRRRLPQHLVYISTSGVYGDCNGAIVDETRHLNPQTQRARRRADAERQIRAWATRTGVCINILRVPGIYATDRLPLERVRQGVPAILADEDSYTNHIHADDLARITVAALFRGKPSRVYHACDDSEMKMGDYFDAVANAYELPCPPRLSRAEVQRAVPASLWSFMNESRRLNNFRMKRELAIELRHPDVRDALKNK